MTHQTRQEHIAKLLQTAERKRKFKETLHTVDRELDPERQERRRAHVEYLLRRYKIQKEQT